MKSLEEYKAWYMEWYNAPPTQKCIDEFCRLHGIKQDDVHEVTPEDWEEFWSEMEVDKIEDNSGQNS